MRHSHVSIFLSHLLSPELCATDIKEPQIQREPQKCICGCLILTFIFHGSGGFQGFLILFAIYVKSLP